MSIQLPKIGWEDGILVTPARVEVGGTIYDVTPEEYSGTTPLSAENLKQMEDNTEDAINQITTYSTTERIVGTWIDGKPIYEITVPVTIANHSAWTDLVTISNLKKAIKIVAVGSSVLLPRYESSEYYAEFLYETGKIRYKAQGQAGNFDLVVQYTKTTD